MIKGIRKFSVGLSVLTLAFLPLFTNAQVFFYEDFENGCASDCAADGYNGSNGAWNVVSTGANGADAHVWYVSCAENGGPAGSCGVGCGSDESLHLSTNASVLGDLGAAYLSGGLGIWFIETSLRIESPTIDCSGRTNISVCFVYMEAGSGTVDDATFWYYDGSTWAQIDPLAKTALGCAPQGTWTAFTMLLPSSADNNANVKIGYNWVNNDDGVGDDPTIAIDDIYLSVLPPVDTAVGLLTVCINDAGIVYTLPADSGSVYTWTLPGGGGTIASGQGTESIAINWGGTPGSFVISVTEVNCSGTVNHEDITVVVSSCAGPPPIASFSASDTLICEGTCISFSDSSTESPTSWAWTFTGGTPGTSTDPNPVSICYNSPGTYQVMLTATNGNGSDDTTMLALIVVNSLATATAGADSTICQTSTYTITGASIGGSASTLVWTTSGTGTFDDSSLIGAVYTPSPADIAAGCVILTITTDDPAGPCGSASDAMNLCFVGCTVPVASFAASSTLICEGSCISFNDSSSGSPTSWAWSFTGATPDTSNVQNPVNICYNTAGTFSVTLIATNGNGSDDSIMASYITVDPPATANAGTDDIICEGSTYTLGGSIGGSASSSEWTTTGDGTFDDSSLVAATYTPGSADISSGSAILILTTDDPAGPCGSAVDSMLLTIDAVATVNAGTDDTICAGDTYTLAGSIGGSASSAVWSSAGDGTFDDTTLLAATYTPGAADISGGSAILILTTDDPSGPCLAAVDSITITINALPVVDSIIAVDATSCGASDGSIVIYLSSGTPPYQYSIDGGTSFSGDSNFTALSTGSYPVTVMDTNGCSVSDGPAIITAPGAPSAPATGTDTSYCEGDSMANMFATPAGGGLITWYSDVGLTTQIDTGVTLMPPDTIVGTTTYYVTETVGGCESPPDSVVITIDSPPTAAAGTDAAICAGSSYTLSGVIGGGATSLVWSTLGDGIFDDTTIAGATYTPGSNDISTGSVNLIISTDDPAGACTSTMDTILLTIGSTPVLDSTQIVDASACGASDGQITAFVSGGTGTYTYSWSSSGTSSTETGLATGGYTVTVTDSLGCSMTSGTITITSPGAPPAPIAGTDSTYCVGDPMADLTATPGSGGTITWYSDAGLTTVLGTGTTLIPGTTVGVTIYYVTESVGTCESPATLVTITIITLPGAPTAGVDATYCEGDALTDLTATPGGGGTITWYSDAGLTTVLGTGTTLTPGSSTGVTTYYVTETVGTCQSIADTVVITIDTCPSPTANFSVSSMAICENACVDFTDLSSGNTTSWVWSFPGATPTSDTSQNPTNICYAAAGTYLVTLMASNSNGSDTATVSIFVSSGPTLTVSNDTTIQLGSSAILIASGADTYTWSTGETGNTISVSPNITTSYIVTGADFAGCVAVDSVTVTVEFENVVYVPNVFSPSSVNMDNKKLYVFGTGIDIFDIEIYDRWGEKVFESSESTQSLRFDGQCCIYGIGWDGTYKNGGKAINSAVFAYILRVTFVDGSTFFEEGNITLIK